MSEIKRWMDWRMDCGYFVITGLKNWNGLFLFTESEFGLFWLLSVIIICVIINISLRYSASSTLLSLLFLTAWYFSERRSQQKDSLICFRTPPSFVQPFFCLYGTQTISNYVSPTVEHYRYQTVVIICGCIFISVLSGFSVKWESLWKRERLCWFSVDDMLGEKLL